ncbi:RNA polymerase sigma-70 factor [Chitinophaga sp. SYP-B3965]|uniref:RNA polymerase sigma factor n=1 Tax=Chitinophaga sp. SYP-B3965 TaxID=2663120 RepID=UPI0012997F1B|nr:RNA polymerase sigma-70 factor [Chitinophaga sp. SYP-B3965]MRG43517.1 RNA polymerase sigma-70 factor [Chitinophaga sp. SYP-B3965]
MYSNWPELDGSVVELFLKGDENAFSTIYHSFAPGLLAYATAICGSPEQAEDIIQDVFVVCWEKRKQIKAEHLNGWFVKVTKNMAVKAFRRNVLITEYIIDDRALPAEEENRLLSEEKAMKIVNALPPERRKIFLLSRIQQKSYREIADELGISVRTVENQISSALKHIRYEVNITELILLISLLTLR